jgi:hypothetical protein
MEMAEAQKSYGKTLAFSKLQMIPVKEEKAPEELGQETKRETGNRKRKTE